MSTFKKGELIHLSTGEYADYYSEVFECIVEFDIDVACLGFQEIHPGGAPHDFLRYLVAGDVVRALALSEVHLGNYEELELTKSIVGEGGKS